MDYVKFLAVALCEKHAACSECEFENCSGSRCPMLDIIDGSVNNESKEYGKAFDFLYKMVKQKQIKKIT